MAKNNSVRRKTLTNLDKKNVATVLGYAGLIPFIAASGVLFTDNPGFTGPALYSLTVYAAVILAFMGAVHWGVAMQSNASSSNLQLVFSVVPALIAWLSLSLQTPRNSLLTLAVSFVAMLVADIYAGSKFFVPSWYRGLRIPLSLAVVVCLLVSAWRVG